jgi:predicted esterase
VTHRFVPGTSGFTILALHEAGGNENDLLPVLRGVAAGAAVLSPRLGGDSAVTAVAAWTAARIQEYALDPARVCAFGYSTGANLAAEILLQHPNLLAGAVLLRPGAVARPAVLPPLESKTVLVVAATQDTTHPPDTAVTTARLLAEAGAGVDFSEHDTDHGLTPHDFALSQSWLTEVFFRSFKERIS